jgi:hypothetical protein
VSVITDKLLIVYLYCRLELPIEEVVTAILVLLYLTDPVPYWKYDINDVGKVSVKTSPTLNGDAVIHVKDNVL